MNCRRIYNLKICTNIIGLILLSLILSATACTSGRRARDINREKIMDFYHQWKGVPYRSGGVTRSGIDCSALMVILFRDQFGISLRPTVAEQVKQGRRVSRGRLKPGDLVFFKFSRKRRHVGVYIGDNRFIHASARRGVTTDELDSYWNKVYWKSRRVI